MPGYYKFVDGTRSDQVVCFECVTKRIGKHLDENDKKSCEKILDDMTNYIGINGKCLRWIGWTGEHLHYDSGEQRVKPDVAKCARLLSEDGLRAVSWHHHGHTDYAEEQMAPCAWHGSDKSTANSMGLAVSRKRKRDDPLKSRKMPCLHREPTTLTEPYCWVENSKLERCVIVPKLLDGRQSHSVEDTMSEHPKLQFDNVGDGPLHDVFTRIEEETGEKFDCAIVERFKDGNAQHRWSSLRSTGLSAVNKTKKKAEKKLRAVKNSTVAVLVLGESRDYALREKKQGTWKAGRPVNHILRNNDLLVFDSAMQDFWEWKLQKEWDINRVHMRVVFRHTK